VVAKETKTALKVLRNNYSRVSKMNPEKGIEEVETEFETAITALKSPTEEGDIEEEEERVVF
jgi:hypothetical protein